MSCFAYVLRRPDGTALRVNVRVKDGVLSVVRTQAEKARAPSAGRPVLELRRCRDVLASAPLHDMRPEAVAMVMRDLAVRAAA